MPSTRQSAIDSCLLILKDWSGGLLLTDEEIEMWVTLAADAYVEVARSMRNDGLLVHPPVGTNVWPLSRTADNGFLVGGLF